MQTRGNNNVGGGGSTKEGVNETLPPVCSPHLSEVSQ